MKIFRGVAGFMLVGLLTGTAMAAGGEFLFDESQPTRPIYGTGSGAVPLPVTISGSGGGGVIQVPNPATTTMSTAAPTAGTFTSVLASNAARKSCTVQNTSASVGYVYPGANGSATTGGSFQVSPGGTFSCSQSDGVVLTDNISATCATGTCAFVIGAQ